MRKNIEKNEYYHRNTTFEFVDDDWVGYLENLKKNFIIGIF